MKNPSPKLSIITINKDNAQGLEATIKSVLSQTFSDYEYIIVDGASTDESLSVIKRYQNNISHWLCEPDSGIYNAMNKGIKLAKGEYLQFLNSGDCLINNQVIERMICNISSNASILTGNLIKKLNTGKLYRDIGAAANENISMLNFYRSTINHSSSYIKKALFDKYGYYDETLKIVSDWKWFLIVVGLNNEKVHYIDLDVVLFDMGGVSTNNKDLNNIERRQVLEQLLPKNILKDYDRYAHLIKKFEVMNKYKFLLFPIDLILKLLVRYENFKIKNENYIY